MNNTIKQLAFQSGIRIDSFGSPVIDHENMLQKFAELILSNAGQLAALEMSKPKKQQGNIEQIIKEKFGLK